MLHAVLAAAAVMRQAGGGTGGETLQFDAPLSPMDGGCATLLKALPGSQLLIVPRAGLAWCPLPKDGTTEFTKILADVLHENASLVVPSALSAASIPTGGILPRILRHGFEGDNGWTPSGALSLRQPAQLSNEEQAHWCSSYASSYTSFVVVRNPCKSSKETQTTHAPHSSCCNKFPTKHRNVRRRHASSLRVHREVLPVRSFVPRYAPRRP